MSLASVPGAQRGSWEGGVTGATGPGVRCRGYDSVALDGFGLSLLELPERCGPKSSATKWCCFPLMTINHKPSGLEGAGLPCWTPHFRCSVFLCHGEGLPRTWPHLEGSEHVCKLAAFQGPTSPLVIACGHQVGTVRALSWRQLLWPRPQGLCVSPSCPPPRYPPLARMLTAASARVFMPPVGPLPTRLPRCPR